MLLYVCGRYTHTHIYPLYTANVDISYIYIAKEHIFYSILYIYIYIYIYIYTY